MSNADAIHEFGRFRFDAADATLFLDGAVVTLSPRTAAVLSVLLTNRGRSVSRAELERAVWGETFVDANNLHQQIAALRKIVGREWIETVPRRGYRFAAEGEMPAADRLSPEREASTGEEAIGDDHSRREAGREEWRSRRRAVGRSLVGAVAALILASCIILYVRKPPSPFRADSMAILPLKALDDSTDGYLTLGLTDALIAKLSSSLPIDVRPLSAVEGYRRLQDDAATAGRRLHVDAVLDGTAQRHGDRVRVSFRLIDVASGRQVWTASYVESLGDLFALQEDVSADVAETLSLRIAPRTDGKRYLGIDPYVVEMYLRGRHYFARREREEFAKSIVAFEKALARDPSFAPAWAGLGDVLNFVGRTDEAKEAARRALRLDPSLADAYATLGNAAFFRDWDFTAAESAFQRAIELNPSCTNARHWYAYLLAAGGRMREAMGELEEARRIDPLSLPISSSIGTLLYFDGRIDEAIAAYQRAAELDPQYAQVQLELGLAHAAKGERDQALLAFARSGVPDFSSADSPSYAYAATLRGDHGAARQALARAARRADASNTDRSIWIAATFVQLGDHDSATEWLRRAIEGHGADALFIHLDPRFAPLRSSPRFRQLLAPMPSVLRQAQRASS